MLQSIYQYFFPTPKKVIKPFDHCATLYTYTPPFKPVKKWSPPTKPCLVLLIGAPGSGKTSFMNDMLLWYQSRDFFKSGFAMTPNPSSLEYLNSKDIVMTDPKALLFHLKWLTNRRHKDKNILILDDPTKVIGASNSMAELQNFYTRYENENTWIFVLTHQNAGASTTARACATHVGLFESDNPMEDKQYARNFTKGLDKKYHRSDQFEKLLLEIQRVPFRFFFKIKTNHKKEFYSCTGFHRSNRAKRHIKGFST